MRLIDADRALEIVREQGIVHPNAYHLTNYATIILMEAPTIEAEPVRNGRWKNEGMGDFRCSLCSFIASAAILNNYCPNCGAKMGGEREET